MGSPRTLHDKLWDAHQVGRRDDGQALPCIDRIVLHEVTSAQAFEGLRAEQRALWRRQTRFAVADHQAPTTDRDRGLAGFADATAQRQGRALDDNCLTYGVDQFRLTDARQGIVHVVGPEQGVNLPGMSVVCSDSHTSTHGALAALAQGIGSSELEHVFATRCLVQQRSKTLRIDVTGSLGQGISAKDLALHIPRRLTDPRTLHPLTP